MKTKAETKVNEYWNSPKVKILTCSWEVVEYGLDLLKRCLRFAWRNPENVFLSEDDCHHWHSFTNFGLSLRLLENTWQQLFLWVINLCLLLVKNGGHFIQVGYFPTQTNFWSFPTSMPVFTAEFSTNHSGSIISKTYSLLLLFSWFEWLERS